MDRMRIGKVVTSRSHVDVTCRIDKPHESEVPPSPGDYAFGRFVTVGEDAVGILYDSQLQNPDFLDEQATLVSLLLLGSLDAQGAHQGVPPAAVPLHSAVRTMDDAAIRRFHHDPMQAVQVRYVPLVLSHARTVAVPLLMGVLDRLSGLFPEDRPRIEVLRKALRWQSIMTAIR